MTRVCLHDRRAVSTVLDVAVCLLFVTAAVGVLATVDRPSPDDSNSADRAASLLGTTTATVHYPAPGSDAAAATDGEHVAACTPSTTSTTGDRPDGCRTAHGTVADLLARAAVADAAGNRSSGDTVFERAVRNATHQRLAGLSAEWQVVVTWRAYPGAPLTGRVVAGAEPPPSTDVHSATLRVPVAGTTVPGAGDETTVEGVAENAAQTAVARLFPPEPTRLALAGGPPGDRRTAARYRRTAATLGVGLDAAVEDGATRRANAMLVDALATRYASYLRDRTDGPAAAAELVSVETATVTVRTWST